MTQTLAEFVAGQLRAEMARRQMSKAELARKLEVDETWVGRRMLGKAHITVGDLERIANAMELPVSFFVRDEVAA